MEYLAVFVVVLLLSLGIWTATQSRIVIHPWNKFQSGCIILVEYNNTSQKFVYRKNKSKIHLRQSDGNWVPKKLSCVVFDSNAFVENQNIRETAVAGRSRELSPHTVGQPVLTPFSVRPFQFEAEEPRFSENPGTLALSNECIVFINKVWKLRKTVGFPRCSGSVDAWWFPEKVI